MDDKVQDMWLAEGYAFSFAERIVIGYPRSNVRIEEMDMVDGELKTLRLVAKWEQGQRTF